MSRKWILRWAQRVQVWWINRALVSSVPKSAGLPDGLTSTGDTRTEPERRMTSRHNERKEKKRVREKERGR